MTACRELYTYPRPVAVPHTKAPVAVRRHRSKRQPQSSTQEQHKSALLDKDLCGVSFGTMGNVAALRSDGSVLVFLLRPSASSPEDPECPMVPTCLADLPAAAQVATGTATCSISTGLDRPPSRTTLCKATGLHACLCYC